MVSNDRTRANDDEDVGSCLSPVLIYSNFKNFATPVRLWLDTE